MCGCSNLLLSVLSSFQIYPTSSAHVVPTQLPAPPTAFLPLFELTSKLCKRVSVLLMRCVLIVSVPLFFGTPRSASLPAPFGCRSPIASCCPTTFGARSGRAHRYLFRRKICIRPVALVRRFVPAALSASVRRSHSEAGPFCLSPDVFG